MEFPDKWFTGLETGFSSLVTLLAGAGATWLALRKRVSSDTTDIRKDRLELGWTERLVKERDDLLARLESMRESQLNDARLIVRLETQATTMGEQIAEMSEQNGRLQLLINLHDAKMGGCEERIRALSEQSLVVAMYNDKLFVALAKADPEAAELLSQQRWDVPKLAAPPTSPSATPPGYT